MNVHASRVQLCVDGRVVVESRAIPHGRHVVDRGLVLQDVGAVIREARERGGEPGAVGVGLHREGAVADPRAGLEGGRLVGLVLGVVVVVEELLRPGHQRVSAGAHVEGVDDLDLARALGQLGALNIDLPDDGSGVALLGDAPLLGVAQDALGRGRDRSSGQVHDHRVHRLRAHSAVADDVVVVLRVLAEGAGHGHGLARRDGAVDDRNFLIVEHAEGQRRAARVRDDRELGRDLNAEHVTRRDLFAGRVNVEAHRHDVDADGGRCGFFVLARQGNVADDADRGGVRGGDRDERGQEAGDDHSDNERKEAPDTAWVHVSLHSLWMGGRGRVCGLGVASHPLWFASNAASWKATPVRNSPCV